jgi:hypothetical protein
MVGASAMSTSWRMEARVASKDLGFLIAITLSRKAATSPTLLLSLRYSMFDAGPDTISTAP